MLSFVEEVFAERPIFSKIKGFKRRINIKKISFFGIDCYKTEIVLYRKQSEKEMQRLMHNVSERMRQLNIYSLCFKSGSILRNRFLEIGFVEETAEYFYRCIAPDIAAKVGGSVCYIVSESIEDDEITAIRKLSKVFRTIMVSSRRNKKNHIFAGIQCYEGISVVEEPNADIRKLADTAIIMRPPNECLGLSEKCRLIGTQASYLNGQTGLKLSAFKAKFPEYLYSDIFSGYPLEYMAAIAMRYGKMHAEDVHILEAKFT